MPSTLAVALWCGRGSQPGAREVHGDYARMAVALWGNRGSQHRSHQVSRARKVPVCAVASGRPRIATQSPRCSRLHQASVAVAPPGRPRIATTGGKTTFRSSLTLAVAFQGDPKPNRRACSSALAISTEEDPRTQWRPSREARRHALRHWGQWPPAPTSHTRTVPPSATQPD